MKDRLSPSVPSESSSRKSRRLGGLAPPAHCRQKASDSATEEVEASPMAHPRGARWTWASPASHAFSVAAATLRLAPGTPIWARRAPLSALTFEHARGIAPGAQRRHLTAVAGRLPWEDADCGVATLDA
mmetsp:Transcript_24841/g.54918  ORF Transcript_24841/g.54918 Transcript_24841/m.54918 type:complete len:129 (-) Transcript_24841:677-1063(-)